VLTQDAHCQYKTVAGCAWQLHCSAHHIGIPDKITNCAHEPCRSSHLHHDACDGPQREQRRHRAADWEAAWWEEAACKEDCASSQAHQRRHQRSTTPTQELQAMAHI
jgi:hypothetical protein